MFLSDVDIKKAVKGGEITLEPFEVARLQPASYDILLGNKFIENDASSCQFSDFRRNSLAPTTTLSKSAGSRRSLASDS